MAANEEMIVGGRQLNDFLQQLPARVEKNIMRAALRAGANVFKAEAKQEVPVDEGDLLASIRVSVKSKRGTIYASVKAGGKRAPHWHLVEFGTRPHKIKPKNAHALTVGGKVVGEVDHPGARAKPFMRPALDSKSAEAIAAVVTKIRERLTKEGINVPAPEGE
jgi:HK97 gp10 family phage protein